MGMAAEASLNHSMDIAVQHYSSLFRLPSHRKVLFFLAVLCVGGGFFSVVLVSPSLWQSGICLGFGLFTLSFLADYFTNLFFIKKDTIFDLRRTLALSLFGGPHRISFRLFLVGQIVPPWLFSSNDFAAVSVQFNNPNGLHTASCFILFSATSIRDPVCGFLDLRWLSV
jgi:predicted transporter